MDATDELPQIPRGPLLLSTVILDVAMLGGAVGLGWITGLPWWENLGVSWWGAGVGTASGLVLIGLIWRFVHRDGPLQALREAFRRDLRGVYEVLSPLGVGDLLFISLGAGLSEEALFRGFVEAAGEHWLGMGPVLGAIAFGLAHPISRVYFVYAGAIGLVMSGLVVVGHGLFAAMVAHAVYDAVALVAGMRSPVIRPSLGDA
ncbi:MAG: CPBP family intramembrane metalloprotease [Deltaproteobacteria bacterium]|nr:MAG: CPBP family intramembrane metalloprotease [Deltaproteobacteria bacterium]